VNINCAELKDQVMTVRMSSLAIQ